LNRLWQMGFFLSAHNPAKTSQMVWERRGP
jgi:hypothetical protein